MNIGELAKRSGVTEKMIRHYEEIAVIPKAKRSSAGYRVYTENDVAIFQFLKRSRDLGFSMAEIKELISLWRNPRRTSEQVKKLAQKHLEELKIKIEKMQMIEKNLKTLIHSCHGDHRSECPILEKLAH